MQLSTLEQPCCTRDGGRPSGAGWQEQAPNPLQLQRAKAAVVSVEEKAGKQPVRWGPRRRTQVNR
jgi:hypothetical protein